MAQLLQLLVRVYSIVSNVLNIVTGIQSAQSAQSTAIQADAIKADTEEIKLKINDSTFGLAQINTNVLAIITDLTADFDALSAQITALQGTVDAGVTVTTVTTGAGDQVAAQVWDWPIPTEGTVAQVCLANAHYYALYRSNYQNPIQVDELGLSYYYLTGNWNVPAQADPDPDAPLPLDFTQIISSDNTVLDFVNRIYPGTFVTLGNGLPAIPDPGSNTYFWVVNIPDDQFLVLKEAALGAGVTPAAAPIWPGLDGVTLGTPVDISLTFTVDGPLAGVLVALTAVPTLKGHYDYDGLDQSLKIGALTFVSDNGDAEYVQALGFTTEVYVPKNMSFAASCKVRTVSGVTGTVTPFTIP